MERHHLSASFPNEILKEIFKLCDCVTRVRSALSDSFATDVPTLRFVPDALRNRLEMSSLQIVQENLAWESFSFLCSTDCPDGYLDDWWEFLLPKIAELKKQITSFEWRDDSWRQGLNPIFDPHRLVFLVKLLPQIAPQLKSLRLSRSHMMDLVAILSLVKKLNPTVVRVVRFGSAVYWRHFICKPLTELVHFSMPISTPVQAADLLAALEAYCPALSQLDIVLETPMEQSLRDSIAKVFSAGFQSRPGAVEIKYTEAAAIAPGRIVQKSRKPLAQQKRNSAARSSPRRNGGATNRPS